jgi:hypothetical protein
MELSYPKHFLHDISAMTDEQRHARAVELIAWTKRLANNEANPKWVSNHLFELAHLLELELKTR